MGYFHENDFLELRPGAFKELQVKLQKINLLLKRYEKELGADKVEEIRAEVNVKGGIESRVSPSKISYYTIISSSNDSSKNVAEDTSAGLAGLESHNKVGDTSPNTIVGRMTRSMAKRQAGNPTDYVRKSEGFNNKKRKVQETSNKNITVSARASRKDGNEDNTTNSKTAEKLGPLNLQWATGIMSLMTHRRRQAHDSHGHDHCYQRVFNCVCGYKSTIKCSLEVRLRQKIFGEVFKCRYEHLLRFHVQEPLHESSSANNVVSLVD